MYHWRVVSSTKCQGHYLQAKRFAKYFSRFVAQDIVVFRLFFLARLQRLLAPLLRCTEKVNGVKDSRPGRLMVSAAATDADADLL
jgi:hypothetical protein